MSGLINKGAEKGSICCNPDILLMHTGICSQAKNAVFNTEVYLGEKQDRELITQQWLSTAE